MHTDLNVGKYWGEMGVDFWGSEIWDKQVDTYEVMLFGRFFPFPSYAFITLFNHSQRMLVAQ